jgi:hypothetical protein
MAEYIETLDLDTMDGNSVLVAGWDEGDSVEVVLITKDTKTWPDDDGLGNLGRPREQTGISSIYLSRDETLKLITALATAASCGPTQEQSRIMDAVDTLRAPEDLLMWATARTDDDKAAARTYLRAQGLDPALYEENS